MNFYYNDRTRSGIFLQAIQQSDYADTVMTLQLHVNSYREQYNNGYLPPHLCLHGLADSIHQNAQARLQDMIAPCLQCTDVSSRLIQGVPTVNRVGFVDRPCGGFQDHGGYGYFLPIDQDFTHNVRDWNTPRDSGDGEYPRGLGARQRTPCGLGRLAHPDRNHHPFLPNVQCTACKWVGHVAKHCDMLATEFCLERYIKHDLSALVCDLIEKDWLAC
jgi:hypothetical protein